MVGRQAMPRRVGPEMGSSSPTGRRSWYRPVMIAVREALHTGELA